MHTPTSTPRRQLLATALLALVGTAASAQTAWPAKPIRLVVGFPAGGTTDVMARVVGHALHKSLGQPVIVDNKPGASGNIAVGATTRAVADGHTLMVAPISVQTANPYLFKPPLNPERDLRPVPEEAPLVGARHLLEGGVDVARDHARRLAVRHVRSHVGAVAAELEQLHGSPRGRGARAGVKGGHAGPRWGTKAGTRPRCARGGRRP